MLTGKNFIAAGDSAAGNQHFHGINPATGQELPPAYTEATAEEVDQAVRLAAGAFPVYSRTSNRERAAFLSAVAAEIEALADPIVGRAMLETALPEARLRGECGRTTGQLRLFAALVEEGSWIEARIDRADPGRQPAARPDIRQMQMALGPVGVFGASNFPLAFSVAGGDTASALAAGCPVVVKGHPAHPGTSELVGTAVRRAVEKSGLPAGVFSLVHGPSPEVGMAIVRHPLIKAIGFTGSFRGGKAIYDAAVRREEPIPVYAEMGSVNPVFVLPGALAERGEEIRRGLIASVTLGVGQFCTNPGLVFGLRDQGMETFLSGAGEELRQAAGGVMLSPGIRRAYQEGVERLSRSGGVKVVGQSAGTASPHEVEAFFLESDAETFLNNPDLEEEVFGPSSLIITAGDEAELYDAARRLKGHLTVTIHGTEKDLDRYRELVDILTQKAGRLIINGFPTGVEVGHAMVHGGPYPATTDSRSTSVGTRAIYRFSRPVCYQNFPQSLLPEALRDGNPLGIRRMVDGKWE